MKKITIIYWSSTGNTELMAKAMADGAYGQGSKEYEVILKHVKDAVPEDVAAADVLALGCPAMGVESLDDSEMEPFVNRVKGLVKNKPLILFGSYDWGDGEWMEDWVADMERAGANLIAESLIMNNEPYDKGLDRCRT